MRRLLDHGADVNKQTVAGETALHLAAVAESDSLLKTLLQAPNLAPGTRDDRGNTAFSKAVKFGWKAGVSLLAPYRSDRLSESSLRASRSVRIKVRDFGYMHLARWGFEKTVHDLLVSGLITTRKDHVSRNPTSPLATSEDLETDFRWLHLPENCVELVELLLIKAFLEHNEWHEIQEFTAIEQSLQTIRRGQKFFSHYMRPFCEVSSAITIDNSMSNITTEKGANRVMFICVPYIHFQRGSVERSLQQQSLKQGARGDQSARAMNKITREVRVDSQGVLDFVKIDVPELIQGVLSPEVNGIVRIILLMVLTCSGSNAALFTKYTPWH